MRVGWATASGTAVGVEVGVSDGVAAGTGGPFVVAGVVGVAVGDMTADAGDRVPVGTSVGVELGAIGAYEDGAAKLGRAVAGVATPARSETKAEHTNNSVIEMDRVVT